MRILVAEADASLAEFLQTRLQQEHYIVQLATMAEHFSRVSDKVPIDLILLDLNVPGIPGPEYLRILQGRWPESPVILLSPAASVEERVKGLDAGADDIVTKPFAWLELSSRIRAVLRRRSRPVREVFQFEDLEVNDHAGGGEIGSPRGRCCGPQAERGTPLSAVCGTADPRPWTCHSGRGKGKRQLPVDQANVPFSVMFKNSAACCSIF